ncbi:MAG: RusA family crossover junction endodeoxyribonuclease [Chloroflexota bacterium]
MPPSVNNQYATVGKRRVLSSTARKFKREVGTVIEGMRKSGALDHRVERVLTESLIGVYLTFYFETPKRRDLDGGLKITLDAVATALGFDDRAVVDIHLTKKIDPLHPRVEVELESIHDWAFDRTFILLADPEDEEAE